MGAGDRLNLPLQPNYFVFMGYFRKMGYTQKNKTPLIYLNPPSKSRPSTPVLVQCFGGGVRGRFRV